MINFKDLESKFIHLHTHNCFSFKDGIPKPESVVEFAKSIGKKYVSTTNHGNICDSYQMLELCKKADITPIIGCELYVNEFAEELQKHIGSEEDEATQKRKELIKNNRHLILLSKNYDGFLNLIQIHNDAWINRFYYRPISSYNTVKSHTNGLIALSACEGGQIPQYIINGEYDKAKQIALEYKRAFGEDYYIELMLLKYKTEEKNIKVRAFTRDLIKLAKEIGVKTVITNDCHYLKKEDYNLQKLQMLSASDSTFKDLDNLNNTLAEESKSIWIFECDDLYYKSVEELHQRFKESFEDDVFTEEVFENSIANTAEICAKIERFEVDKSSKLPKLYENSNEILKQKTMEGFIRRGMAKRPDLQKYVDRANYELSVIDKKGFADYFLILDDIIEWTKKTYGADMIGPGRGSAAGSLINYLLGLTDVDPIKHGLMFERFLDVEREDSCDIDTDMATPIRQNVVDYISEKFGANHVSSIGTVSKLGLKYAIADVAKVFGIKSGEVFALTKTLNLDEEAVDLKIVEENNPNLKYFLDKYTDEGYDLRFYINGLIGNARQVGRHAAGILITSVDLEKTIPIVRANKSTVTGWQEGLTSRELSNAGFYKFDMLGLSNLQTVSDAVKLVEKNHNVKINWDNIDLETPEPYKQISNGDTYGIFQFEANSARGLIMQIRPETFHQLASISALLRPGPMGTGMHTEFAKRKNKQVQYTIHESLKEILEPTFGILVFQEQIMKIANKVGGFTVAETNYFRKALVKDKNAEVYDKMKGKFLENASKILGEKEAIDLFEQIHAFLQYSFNLSHAVSYTYTSFREVWLKTFYRDEFNVSLLNNTEKGKDNKDGDSVLEKYLLTMADQGYKIVAPNVNECMGNFAIKTPNAISFGLDWIKGIPGEVTATIEKLAPFTSFEDFVEKMGGIKKVNKRAFDALFYSGALDCFGERTEIFNKYFYTMRKEKLGKHEFPKNFEEIQTELMYVNFEKIKNASKRKEILNAIKEKVKNQNVVASIETMPNDSEITVACYVDNVKDAKTKTGKGYFRVTLTDFSSDFSVFMWPRKGEKLAPLGKNEYYVMTVKRNEEGWHSLTNVILMDYWKKENLNANS